jgi:hypothetical protein
MSLEEQAKLMQFLDKNNNVFAWSTFDLVGVSREVTEHKLQVNPHAKPKKQKLHKKSEEKIEAVKPKVQWLLDAWFINEVRYPQWLANIVMVRKKNGKWWLCLDFTDLNKWSPKDDFPLARIDQIINSANGCDIIALLDYFWGYHQIWLRREDEEKTSFITPFGTYCYMKMVEGLRNVGPAFCRMMKAAFKDHVSRNVLSYVNDIIVASKKKATYISNPTETFTNMREANLKLNPEKCVFGVTWGKVLCCLVSTKGIDASSDKIKAILQMQPSQTRKEVQKLLGRIAALNRFIVKLVERSIPFFSVLRGSTKVDWGTERQKAFDDLKHYLEHLSTLLSLEQGQPLILYVFVTHSAGSGALVVKIEITHKNKTAKQQFPVYFISEVLTGSKKFYSEMEKILMQLLWAHESSSIILKHTQSKS